MEGRIKFVDGRSGQWGFIVPTDGSPDVHFAIGDVDGATPSSADADAAVEFELAEGGQRRHVKWMRLLVPPLPPPPSRGSGVAIQGKELTSWAYVPYVPFRSRDDRDYSSILEYLAKLTLEERWHFGTMPDPRAPYPILDNYFTYTFGKLRRENKVFEKTASVGGWAAFNTGLVDRLYDPIYALFEKNDRPGLQPWRFHDFCVPGKRASGRKLTEVFDPLPEPAKYFSSSFDMLFDTSKDIHVDYEHVILDGVARDRFPAQFLREHVPEGFEWEDMSGLTREDRQTLLTTMSQAIEDEARCMRAIKRRLEDAKLLAEKRIRWNFKTAIPQYHPRFDVMSLLLPLALINDEIVDIALVVTRNPSGSYQGRTILPLDLAYQKKVDPKIKT
ncbi:MAG TPA: DUF3825 domain-containing protein, partial [Terriglobia bacterium]|nr:DUF3825 domain-containing protein [Terriglobia bacterium]